MTPLVAPVVCPLCGADLVVIENSSTIWPVHPRTGVFDSERTDQQEVHSTYLTCTRRNYDSGNCEFWRALPIAQGKVTIDPALLDTLTYIEAAAKQLTTYVKDIS